MGDGMDLEILMMEVCDGLISTLIVRRVHCSQRGVGLGLMVDLLRSGYYLSWHLDELSASMAVALARWTSRSYICFWSHQHDLDCLSSTTDVVQRSPFKDTREQGTTAERRH